MICPFMSIPSGMSGAVRLTNCLEDRCALWVNKPGFCAIKQVAMVLTFKEKDGRKD